MATPSELLQSALDHHRDGRLQQAEQLYRQILRVDPGQVTVHNNLGIALRQRGALDEAETCFRRALGLNPDHAIALNNLGTMLLNRGALAEARAALERAVRLNPAYGDAYNGLGAVLQKSGQWAEAEECLARALQLQPRSAAAHYNLGAVLHARGLLAEAEASLRQALGLKPDFAEALYELGAVLKDGIRFVEAQACLEHCLLLKGDHVAALSVLATVLEWQGKFPEAKAILERATAIRPCADFRVRLALLLPVIHDSPEGLHAARARLEAELDRLRRGDLHFPAPEPLPSGPPFFLAHQGLNDRDVQQGLADLYARSAPWLQFVAPHCLPSATSAAPATVRHAPRIGVLSSFFFDHTIGRLNAGWIRNLSRAHLDVILFRFPGPDDPMARQLREGADRVVTLPRKLEDARRLIAEEELDVLLYTDIGMEPLTYFLAFARLAPVQCVTWGHPVTTGIPTIDYFLSSTHLEPEEADGHYTETLVRLERVNTYYQEPRLTSPARCRADFGLGEDSHLYLCTQTLFKFHPEFDAILGQILRGDPEGRVVLIEGQLGHWTQLLGDRFRRTIPDVAGRIVVLPRLSREDFLHLQALADVLLDTIHFGGGNTSYEALAFGTPIVTLPAPFLRGRITHACYRQMGVLDCLAEGPEDYARIALRLGTDRAWRDSVRSRILDRKHLLYEDGAAVRELERFFLEAVARTRAGTNPRPPASPPPGRSGPDPAPVRHP